MTAYINMHLDPFTARAIAGTRHWAMRTTSNTIEIEFGYSWQHREMVIAIHTASVATV